MAFEGREHVRDVPGMGVDRGRHEVVLGLEVVVDVADRDIGRLRDIRDRRLLHALLVEHLACTRDESLALAGLHGR